MDKGCRARSSVRTQAIPLAAASPVGVQRPQRTAERKVSGVCPGTRS
jgi:hypothetical protein